MFGWLASFGMHSRARSTPPTRWLAITPRTLVEGLGQLGGVLYLAPRSAACPVQADAAFGCLVESADLAPLLATRHVGLTCAITAEGPREWIDCVGGEGEALARIYLLPDTDYLAWDGLFVDATPVGAPNRELPDREWLRASRARVLSFTRKRLVGFTVLGARDVLISSLGRGVARDIAVSESVGITV
jgi:hypothetical protein